MLKMFKKFLWRLRKHNSSNTFFCYLLILIIIHHCANSFNNQKANYKYSSPQMEKEIIVSKGSKSQRENK